MANQISVFLDPTQMPNQSQDQTTFDKLWAAVLAALPNFGAQFNAAVANLNASLNGAGIAIPYTIDLTSTADTDPGTGKLRFGSVTQNTSTVLRLDLLSSNTGDYTAVLDTLDASTSTVKGRLGLVKQGDAKTFLAFDVSARATATGYRNISVTPVASSSANPFANGDAVLLYFQRNGDMGSTGNQLTQMIHVREEYASGYAAPNITSGTLRVLNTVKVNTVTGASLSANSVTLPAGTYDFEGSAALYGSGNLGHRVSLWSGTDLIVGPNEWLGSSSTSITRAYIQGRLVLSTTTAISLRHLISNVANSYPGGAAASIGGNEVYSELIFRKIS